MNKFLIVVLLIILSIHRQEIASGEITHAESLVEITPVLPDSLTSYTRLSFKISNIGVNDIPSFIFQVSLIDPDNKLIWEKVKTSGLLKPNQRKNFKFYIPLKEIKDGNYQLKYILIYANKEVEDKIDIPSKIPANISRIPSGKEDLKVEKIENVYTIGASDILEIFVSEDPDLRKAVTVTPDGKIYFPIVGNIDVIGMTPTELSKKIANDLSKKDYLVNPTVTVAVVQINSKKFSIIGEVVKPGVFSVNEEITLLKAIALAGGFTPFADLRKITVLRKKDVKYDRIKIDVTEIIKKGKLQKNIGICPEDIIIVPASLF
ncbi:MAG: polysaccharide biosynthesis/export family protein [bacterium]